MKSVATAAGCCVVKRNLQIVLAEKPAEGTPGLFKPVLLVCQPVCLETSRDCCASLDWLLIEASLLTTLCEKSSGADRNEDLFIASVLLGDKPFKRLTPYFDHPLVVTSPSCD